MIEDGLCEHGESRADCPDCLTSSMKASSTQEKSSELWEVPVTARYTFSQEADSLDAGNGQTLMVEVDDGGGGNYLVLSTDRWALNPEDIDRFAALLKRCLRGQTGLRDFFAQEQEDEKKDSL
jgi:hypothetical protein